MGTFTDDVVPGFKGVCEDICNQLSEKVYEFIVVSDFQSVCFIVRVKPVQEATVDFKQAKLVHRGAYIFYIEFPIPALKAL